MSINLSRDFINNLVSNINIVDIISSYIKLEKKGINYIGLCPFHDEKTPSFYVYTFKQRYYCFGCLSSGDVIQFIINYKSINFIESIKYLSNTIGIDLQNNIKSNKKGFNYYNIMKNITSYYKNDLKKHMSFKGCLYKYIIQRNLSLDILNFFDVGYACNNYTNIINNFSNVLDLKKKLIFCGLVIDKGSKVYDRFVNRIILPIKDENGNIVGFGGRTLIENFKPKYINSPESIFFKKGHLLYGLYEAKKKSEFLKQLIIVEGYFDVITLHQYGIVNVVATLGSYFTDKHLDKIKKYYKEIVFCYDGDAAGRSATWKSANNCLSILSEGIIVKFLLLPESYDPDSFIRENGKKSFLNELSNSISLIDYIFKRISKNMNLKNIDDKLVLIKYINDLIKKIPDAAFKKVILNYLLKLIEQKENIESSINKNKKINYFSDNKNKDRSDINLHILSPIMKSLFLLLENRYLINDIINFEIKNINLKDIYYEIDVFFYVIKLLRININTDFSNINIIKKYRINFLNSEFNKIMISMSKDEKKKEFKSIINLILKDNYKKKIDELIKMAENKNLSNKNKLLLDNLLIKIHK